jgi:L-alanine-DL-glutamate epimerase-like enolase superfamily enzyme
MAEKDIAPARISERLHQQHFWLGRGGSVTHVISGVDIALWDLFGKHLGVSVARLIGGRYRDRVRPYASLAFNDDNLLEGKIESALARGFMGVKVGWGTFGRLDRKNDETLTARCRRAAGDGVTLMIDAGGSDTFYNVTYKRALETAKMLRDYDVEWYEEALRPDDIEGFIKLREHSPVKISSCEVLTRRQTFLPWIERGAVDIVQPDSTKVGGLTEALRIAWHAYDHGIEYVGHGWNTAFGLAADLQIAAALPSAQWVEYISPSPLLDNITTTSYVIKDGYLDIPDTPGLGIEPDMDKVLYYATPGA